METQPTCPSCHKTLPPGTPLGLCPECLIKSGFKTGTDPAATAGAAEKPRFVPPQVEELARLFPQLEILSLVGQGGMGAVYKARQPALDRFVALKILPPGVGADPGFAERFNREARALARLSHPHIVAVHDFGFARSRRREEADQTNTSAKVPPSHVGSYDVARDGIHYLIMEFVDGANLRQVEQAGRLAPEQALQIVPQICEALQFAHNEGIVHRDIKPENVLIDKKGRVKITDFGIAKILAPTGRAGSPLPAGATQTKGGAHGVTRPAPALTGAKDVVGTPHYMAPEQVEHPQTVDHRADIYSLGVVFYEMLTGELPLGKFAPPSKKVQVDVRLDEVVLRTLEKEPELRYQQASEVKTQVETIATTSPDSRWREEAAKEGEQRELPLATMRYNPWEVIMTLLGTFFCIVMLFVVPEFPRPLVAPLMVMCIIILGICALTWAGLWPFPSPLFPQPNFASRNLPRRKTTPSSQVTAPRFSRTAIWGAVLATLPLLALLAYVFARVVGQELRHLPTTEVIKAGLADPKSPWAWAELERRAKAGRLRPADATMILDGMTSWIRRNYPQGYKETLPGLPGLSDELSKRHHVNLRKALDFLQAFHGNPTLESLPRIRENDRTLRLTCLWRNHMHEHLFGLRLLNEMRSITIDGQVVKWRNMYPNCDQYLFDGELTLPALAPGKHLVKCEIQSGLVPEDKVIGIPRDAQSKDWRDTKRMWKRICQVELTVYPLDAELVSLTQDPTLDPVATGALSVKQVIIRSKGDGATAVIKFDEDYRKKLLVPISFDVTLRVGGQTHRCGYFGYSLRDTGVYPRGYSPQTYRLGADISRLDPQVREAGIVLTPNPKMVERELSIDRIWGREIVFSHVPLVRQDLGEAEQPHFGPVVERVIIPVPKGTNCFLDLETGSFLIPPPAVLDAFAQRGEVVSVLTVPPTATTVQAWLRESGADLTAGGRDHELTLLGGLALSEGNLAQPRWSFDTVTPEEVQQLTTYVAEAKTGRPPFSFIRPGDTKSGLWLFRTREDGCGVLEHLGTDRKTGGVKIRYKLVQNVGVATQADSAPSASEAVTSADQWQKRIIAMNQMDWRGALALAHKVAALPPEEGWAVVRDHWSTVTNAESRKQFLKAFVFADHPRTLAVLHLGLQDPAPAVQNWGLSYLKDIALHDFADDFAAAQSWVEARKNRSLDEVMKASAREAARLLKNEQPDAVHSVLTSLGDSNRLRRHPDAVKESGLDEALEAIINGPDESLVVLALKTTARGLNFGEAWGQRVLLPRLSPSQSVKVRGAAVSALGSCGGDWAVNPLLTALTNELADADSWHVLQLSPFASALARIGSPRAIPTMIAVIEADNTYDTVYGVGYFGLGKLTGVSYDEKHDGAWWRTWWEKNKQRFPAQVQALEVPHLEPVKRSPRAKADQAEAADVADVPAQQHFANGDTNKLYFLIGRTDGAGFARTGYRLLLVLPGGDGGRDFQPFIKRIYKNALPEGYLIAQLVAPKWDEQQFTQLVWPTEADRYPAMKFSTEEFVCTVVADIEKEHHLDTNYIFSLSWSSGGPAAYAVSLDPATPVTGSFVAMSVFKPAQLPDLKHAQGRSYYLLHSPEDFIPMRMAEQARDALKQHGATVQFQTYSGGHGWRGDVYGMIRKGLAWLEQHASSARAQAHTLANPRP